MRYAQWALVCLIGSAALTLHANTHQHGAHEHGRGVMNVVTQGREVLIELELPAVHVVGFEHAPRTDAERHAIEAARERYSDAAALFRFADNAQCTSNSTEIHLGEDVEHGHSGEHSQLHAEYAFSCHHPQHLNAFTTRLFEHLEGLERLEVNVITPSLQTRIHLSSSQSAVSLRR